MAGGRAAMAGGRDLEREVASLAERLGLRVGPIPGIVVFAGQGFSDNMRAYLHSTGKAVAYEDLQGWLTLFFGLPDGAGQAEVT